MTGAHQLMSKLLRRASIPEPKTLELVVRCKCEENGSQAGVPHLGYTQHGRCRAETQHTGLVNDGSLLSSHHADKNQVLHDTFRVHSVL